MIDGLKLVILIGGFSSFYGPRLIIYGELGIFALKCFWVPLWVYFKSRSPVGCHEFVAMQRLILLRF